MGRTQAGTSGASRAVSTAVTTLRRVRLACSFALGRQAVLGSEEDRRDPCTLPSRSPVYGATELA